MADSSSLPLLGQMSPGSIEGSPRTSRTWKPWTDEERALLKHERNLWSHISWSEFAKLNLIPGRSKNSLHLEFSKMEKADRQRKLESRKRQSENNGPDPKSPVHPSKRRPIVYETIVVDSDEDESSHEDGSILYSGQREPLQTLNKISSLDTGRSFDKREQTATLLLKLPYKPIQPATGLPAKPPCPVPTPPVARESESRQNTPTSRTTMPIKPTQLAAGLPAKPPCPVTTPPVATESENESRLTENALATLQSQNISDATNTHSAPMSVSDATEPVDSPARNVPSDTSKMGRIHEVTSTPVVTGSLPLNQPHRAAEPAPSSAVSPMTAKLPPLSQQRKDNIAPPISAVTPVTIGGRSASLPVTHPHVPKLNARRPDQTDNFTSPKYKIPSSLPNELTQESEITETCRALSYLFQLRANESERRDADEKATATQQRNLQQQIDDLKRSQKALEELVTTQTKRIEELIALGEEKDRRNAELETFKRGVVDLVETQPYKRASTKESSTG